MKPTFQLLLYAAVFGLLASCSKSTISDSFEGQPAVYFVYAASSSYSKSIDSISYTFVEKSSDRERDTLWLPVRITGNAADHDRTINLVADAENSTAVEGVHYQLLDYTMPKDSFAVSLGVVLIRDASLQDTSKTLTLEFEPSPDFPALMKDTLMNDGSNYTRNQVKIIFTDRLIKPDNWDSYLVNFFGAYSDTKFRFIASVLGRSSFSTSGTDPVNYPKMQYYQNTVRNALVVYNAANGPLIDENGNTVVIP